MKVLDRYISKTVISGTFMVLLILMSLLSFIDFIDEAENVGKASYGWPDAILYIVLVMPGHIYMLFPTAVLLGSLLSLGALASNSELIAMRAAGISIGRIVRSVLKAGLILVVIIAFVGEVLVPLCERQAQSIKATALQQKITLGDQHGFWARDRGKYIHVGRVYPDMQISNVEIYELNEQLKLVSSTHAESASYINNRWHLKAVNQTRFTDDQINHATYPTLEWKKLLNPEVFNIVSVEPQNMQALDSYRYSRYLQKNDLDASHYKLAFWIKVMTPVSSLVMLLIAMPFIFGSPRSGDTGQRVLIGLLLGIGFFMLNQTLNHLGRIYGIPPFLSAVSPVAIVALFGVFAIKRLK